MQRVPSASVMAALQLPFGLDPTKLKQFHADHFTSQPIPNISSASALRGQEEGPDVAEDDEEYDDGLGYYEDGVKRTLTDEQIAMFRHSEIERLRAQRRRDVETKHDENEKRGEAEEIKKQQTTSRPEAPERSSMTTGRAGAVTAKARRKAHFDEPQDENAEVILDY